MAEDRKQLEFLFPFKGYDVGTSIQKQPPFTTLKALNVWPYDHNGRPCGAVRPGIRLISSQTFKDGITAITRAKVNVTDGNGIDAVILADGAGSIWYTPSIGTLSFTGVATGASVSGVATGSTLISNTDKVFIVDGTQYPRQFNFYNPTSPTGPFPPGQWPPPSDPNAVTNTATSNLTASAGAMPQYCTFGIYWRARLLLSGQPKTPHIVYASRQGNETDWDTSVINDPGAAWALNAAQAGQIGDSVVALIPINDDTLLICGTHSIYRLDGDVTAGGSLSLITTDIGIVGNRAWCMDGEGVVYFVSHSGFFSCNGRVKNISETRLGTYWSTYCTKAYRFILVYEPVRHGVWIFCIDGSGHGVVSLFYDIGADGFFPMALDGASGGNLQDYYGAGPLSAVWSHDKTGTFRGVLLGGSTAYPSRNAYLRFLGSTGCGLYDEDHDYTNVAIRSYVVLGPQIVEGDFDRKKSFEMSLTCGTNLRMTPGPTPFTYGSDVPGLVLGTNSQNPSLPDSVFGMSAAVLSSPDLVSVSHFEVTTAGNLVRANSNVTAYTQRFTAWGWNPPFKDRQSDKAFALAIWNAESGKTWSFERAVLRIGESGRAR
jgi:hypothetical protein